MFSYNIFRWSLFYVKLVIFRISFLWSFLETAASILISHWKCFVLWLAHTKSIVILPYIQVESFCLCFLHVHRLYDAAASPGSRLRSLGSLATRTVAGNLMYFYSQIYPNISTACLQTLFSNKTLYVINYQ